VGAVTRKITSAVARIYPGKQDDPPRFRRLPGAAPSAFRGCGFSAR